jgi:hypothetical protein
MVDVEQWSDELGKHHASCLDIGLPAIFEMFCTEGVCTEGVAPDNGINPSICLPRVKIISVGMPGRVTCEAGGKP